VPGHQILRLIVGIKTLALSVLHASYSDTWNSINLLHCIFYFV